MKKKVVILTLLFLLAVGSVVSAASVWGAYKGNNIIKLTVDGDPVIVHDVPAINYQGRTMLPIYLLQQAGINYTWDTETQTVNIKKQVTQPPKTVQSASLDVPKLSKIAKAHNVEFVEYLSDGKGFNSLTFYYDFALVDMKDETFDALFTLSANSDSTLTTILDINEITLSVPTVFIRDFKAGRITNDQFQSHFSIEGPNASDPTNNYTPTDPSATTCTEINNRYDKNAEDIRIEENRRGGTYSGGLEYRLQANESGRKSELSIAGCPA